MLTVRVGKMARRQNFRGKVLQVILVLLSLVLFITFVLHKYSVHFKDIKDDLFRAVNNRGSKVSAHISKVTSKAGPCVVRRDCPEDQLSFFIRSGAANVVAPKICVQNKLVLGKVKNNAGQGINVVIINGKTGDIVKTGHVNMYSGDVNALITLLKSIETGSVVLMASYDDPASKLNAEAKKLIAELGSSAVTSLGFRDNWVFVGGKGASVRSNFEKHLKNNGIKNKYKDWPELIELEGCIPKYVE